MLASFGYILWQARRSMYNLKVHSQPLFSEFFVPRNGITGMGACRHYCNTERCWPHRDMISWTGLIFRQFFGFFPVNGQMFRCCSTLFGTDITRISDILISFYVLKSKFAPRHAQEKKKKGKNQIEVEGCMSNLFCFILQSLAAKTVMKKMAQRICIYNP